MEEIALERVGKNKIKTKLPKNVKLPDRVGNYSIGVLLSDGGKTCHTDILDF